MLYRGRGEHGKLSSWLVKFPADLIYSRPHLSIFHAWYLFASVDQDAAPAYIQMLRAVDADISMAEIGEAWQNGYAERLIRTIKEEEVDLSDYQCYIDTVSQLGRFLNDVYMHKRIHSSLGYLTPAEFEQQWRREREWPLDVHQKRLQKRPVSWGHRSLWLNPCLQLLRPSSLVQARQTSSPNLRAASRRAMNEARWLQIYREGLP